MATTRHGAKESASNGRGDSSSKAAPWDRENPKPAAKRRKLSPQAKSSAKRSAKKAGRPYPNLVDNMRAARKDGK